MTRYPVQPRNPIFVKSYGFLSFDKNMRKNIEKNISKQLSGKYSQKLLDHVKQSATDAFKNASKRAIEKSAETTGDLIGIKICLYNYKSFKNFTTNEFRGSYKWTW